MKTLLFCLLTLFSVSCFGQVVKEGNTFKSSKADTTMVIKTKYQWEDKKGNKYPIYQSKKGALYIIRVSSKTGKEYKYYLPKKTQELIKKMIK